MPRVRSSLCAILVMLLAPACLDGFAHLSANDTTPWKERFLQEAPRAWRSYAARAKRLQGSFSITFHSLSPNKQVTLDRRIEFKQRDGCALYLRQSVVESSNQRTGLLRVANPNYAFELRRQNQKGPWAVSQVDVDLSNGVDFPSPIKDVELWSTCPFTLALIHETLGSVTPDSGFGLSKVTPVSRDGEEWAKVEFDYRPQGDSPRIPWVRGSVVFDPAPYWLIQEYNVQIGWSAVVGSKGTMAATYQYTAAGDDLPVIKRIIRNYKIPARSHDTEDTYVFDVREADLGESDFTLTAFGFPEPPSAGRAPTRWYLLTAVGAIVCLGLAVLVRRMAQRA